MAATPAPGGAPNLILAGFMGSGKTTVGRALAARLGRPFLDFDTVLEAQFGQPIAAVFAQQGEAVFRAAEAALCRSLSAGAGLVIATGGGAVVDAGNRQALAERGVLICLTCRPAAILARVGAEVGRPLLAQDAAAAIRDLLAARAAAYAAIPHQVDASDRTPEQVAERVLALYAAALGAVASQ